MQISLKFCPTARNYIKSILRFIPVFLLAYLAFSTLLSADTITFTYDELNRLTSATYTTARIDYHYDSAGNITQVVTPLPGDSTYYRDADDDGYGDPTESIQSYTQPRDM